MGRLTQRRGPEGDVDCLGVRKRITSQEVSVVFKINCIKTFHKTIQEKCFK